MTVFPRTTRRLGPRSRSLTIAVLLTVAAGCGSGSASLQPDGPESVRSVPRPGTLAPTTVAPATPTDTPTATPATPTITAPPIAGPTRAAPVAAARPTSYEQTRRWVNSYRRAHPGRSGDINAIGPADAIGRRLLAACGSRQRPVFPLLAWEYGGNDHAWKHPEKSALAYCVYSPVKPSTAHWKYARGRVTFAQGRVTADVYVLFPAQNPCRARRNAQQVLGCLGDPSNAEILVDTASLHDGHDAGLELREASTDLMLILPGTHTKVRLIHD